MHVINSFGSCSNDGVVYLICHAKLSCAPSWEGLYPIAEKPVLLSTPSRFQWWYTEIISEIKIIE